MWLSFLPTALIKHVRLPSPWFPASNSKQETQSICWTVRCLRISSMIQQGLCNLPDFSQCPVWSRYSKWHTRFTRDSHDVNLQIRKYFNPLISIYRSLYPCLAKATSTGTEQRCVTINWSFVHGGTSREQQIHLCHFGKWCNKPSKSQWFVSQWELKIQLIDVDCLLRDIWHDICLACSFWRYDAHTHTASNSLLRWTHTCRHWTWESCLAWSREPPRNLQISHISGL